MKLYKYLQEKHLSSLLIHGDVRVGTLQGYALGEHGSMVSDNMEGKKRIKAEENNVPLSTFANSRSFRQLFKIDDYSTNIEIPSLQISNTVLIERDYFIFCAAQQYCPKTHKKWKEKEGYDSCYQINNVINFFASLHNELNKHSTFYFKGIFKVVYYDENNGLNILDMKDKLPAFQLKSTAVYSDQIEYRAVWEPAQNQSIKPINLYIPYLSRHISVHKKI